MNGTQDRKGLILKIAKSKVDTLSNMLKHLYGEEEVSIGLKPVEGQGFKNSKVKWKDLDNAVKFSDKYDVYFTFAPLKDNSRNRGINNALDTWCFGVDIDSAPIPDEFPPQIVWESSPNKLQGCYILDHAIPVDKITRISRGLSDKFGYDPGSVDGVHLFRLPGTKNHKYPSSPEVGQPYLTGESLAPYRVRDLEKFEMDSPSGVVEDFEAFEEEEPKKEYTSLERYPLSEFHDRSTWHFKIVAALKYEGATKGEIYYLVSRVKGIKWTGEALKRDISKSYDRVVTRAKTEYSPDLFTIVPISDVEKQNPTWLIDGLWGEGDVGLVSAAPKSYKSTLCYDMAISVASGLPFYGHKTKQGGVAILQLENSDYATKRILHTLYAKVDSLPIYLIKGGGSLDHIGQLVNALPEDVKLLIIDPLYFAWGSGTIAGEEARLKLRAITDAVKPKGIATILVHHTRKSDGDLTTGDMYGSQFLASWYESLIIINKVKGADETVKLSAHFRNFRPMTYLYHVRFSGLNSLETVTHSSIETAEESVNGVRSSAARALGFEYDTIEEAVYNDGKLIIKY